MDTEIEDVKLSDVRPYQNRFRVVFKVIEKTDEREVGNKNSPGETHRLSNIMVADDSASIVLTAWDDDIDLLEPGRYYSLANGYVNIFRDSMRLARGRYGDFAEVEDAEFEANTENNRSDEVHERRPRKNTRSSGGNWDNDNSYGNNQRSGGGGFGYYSDRY